MTKIDLITGFLGSGKTTFLKLYAKHLLHEGFRIGILENDYGAVNVDMMLLQELEGDNCELEMVAGACHKDCHIRRFKTKLIALGMSGYDRVIVEPSGIFDVDEFFDVLSEEPLNRMYEIGSVISIVDAGISDNLSSLSDYYLASQIANAGVILLSRTQLCDNSQIEQTINHIKRACKMAKVQRDITPIIQHENWFEYDRDDLNLVMNSGYCASSFEKQLSESDNSYSSEYFLNLPMTSDRIQEKVATLFSRKHFGHIYRIKGFYRENEQWYEVNACSKDVRLMPIANGQEVIIVIGENLNRTAIGDEMHR